MNEEQLKQIITSIKKLNNNQEKTNELLEKIYSLLETGIGYDETMLLNKDAWRLKDLRFN